MEACMKGIHTGSFSFCEGKRLRKIRLAKRKKIHHGQQTHDSPRCRFLHRAPRQGAHGPEDHGEHEPLVYPRARDHRASVRHLGALVLRRVPASARRGVAVLRRLHHARGGLFAQVFNHSSSDAHENLRKTLVIRRRLRQRGLLQPWLRRRQPSSVLPRRPCSWNPCAWLRLRGRLRPWR